MEEIGKHFFVSGHVQGVFFRAATEGQARELGLRGWVRNLPDGRVEVLAVGDGAALEELEDWLWLGPERAEVDKVVSQLADDEMVKTAPPDGFNVRRD